MPPQPRALTIEGDGLLHELRIDVGITEWMTEEEFRSNPREIPTFSGIWDTGASTSAIDPRVVQKCSLHPIGRTKVQTANGTSDSEVYGINIYVPKVLNVVGIQATCGELGPLTDVLIGMDVITMGDFAISNKDAKTMMSFRYPSTEHIDFTDKQARI